MKKESFFLSTAALWLLLSSCGTTPAPDMQMPSGTPEASLESSAHDSPDEETHSHTLPSENNVLEHDPAGYCGNTVTTVAYRPVSGEGWENSFWGSDSVKLTDLLRFLDYSEELCRCIPEYTVSTEFGQDYGINLTEGYVRHENGQVSLTAEQLETIRGILERASAMEKE